jgi:hypothetical protein
MSFSTMKRILGDQETKEDRMIQRGALSNVCIVENTVYGNFPGEKLMDSITVNMPARILTSGRMLGRKIAIIIWLKYL